MTDRATGQAMRFGDDAAGYDAGRPGYPEALYARLAERAGLAPGIAILEIGAGTGLATRRLLGFRPARLVAVEPDARMAALLAKRLPAGSAEIVVAPFEAAPLPAAAFDLAVAATAFHWCDPEIGAVRAARALRPGGRLALWWNIYQSPEGEDAFSGAISPAFETAGLGPAIARSLPDLARLRPTLEAAGFAAVREERLCWTLERDAAGIRALYATMSPVRGLPEDGRARFLDAIETLARERFGGRVERRCHTLLLTARR